MTNTQVSVFSQSTSGVVPGQLLVVIAGVLAVIYLLWLAWLAHAQLVAWQTGHGVFFFFMTCCFQSCAAAWWLCYLAIYSVNVFFIRGFHYV